MPARSNLRAERFKWLTADGTGLLALSYRGYGGSSGKPSEVGLIRDARAAYDFAAARYAPKRIVLFGELLGTAVAIALAAEREIAALILDAPFTTAADVGAAAYPFAPVRWLMKDTYPLGPAHWPGQGADPGAAWRAGRVVPIRLASGCSRWRPSPSAWCAFPPAAMSISTTTARCQVVKEFLAGFPDGLLEREANVTLLEIVRETHYAVRSLRPGCRRDVPAGREFALRRRRRFRHRDDGDARRQCPHGAAKTLGRRCRWWTGSPCAWSPTIS